VGGLTATLPGVDPVMDPESRAWVAALAGEGGDREAALERLHALLLRAARFELLAALRAAVAEVLTPHQREVLLTVVAGRVPLDRYVELELAGEDPDAHLPGLRAHLAGCLACREEHESLRALVAGDTG
jgi:hypothetical protein